MRVTQVALRPTQASEEAGRPALTPELLAATGARYSRSNDGLEAILSKIDPANPDKSVDSIFKMVDYGHASIADMAPVALFMDEISMWLAYHLWSLCPTAGGQESSTRYIRLSTDNLPTAEAIGIPASSQGAWEEAMGKALEAYETALEFWEEIARQNPEVTRLPQSLLEDPSEKAQKTVARLRRNYAFDRARYFLPAALKTNVMMVQSARAWVTLCQQLLSHPLSEAQTLGAKIREELALVAPRLIKHAEAKAGWRDGFELEFARWQARTHEFRTQDSCSGGPFLQAMAAEWSSESDLITDLEYHSNRYAFLGSHLARMAVRFGWHHIAFGDIRDLNRHRTGTKYCPLAARGFYAGMDQCDPRTHESAVLAPLERLGVELARNGNERLKAGEPSFVYWFLLGTQLTFEHTTTADKFIYEAELRTGLGAHYRYAHHLREVLALWYEKFPQTRGLILEGSAEPE